MANGVIKLPLSIVGPLWTNPNPTTSFAAQTIALDLANYDGVIVSVYSPQANAYRYYPSLDKDIPVQMHIEVNSRAYRNFTVTDTGVTFATAQFASNNSDSVSNNTAVMIPQKIWGIKGIITP